MPECAQTLVRTSTTFFLYIIIHMFRGYRQPREMLTAEMPVFNFEEEIVRNCKKLFANTTYI